MKNIQNYISLFLFVWTMISCTDENFGGGKNGDLTINEDECELLRQKERDALIALYNATDGPQWINNSNWCSDKPLREWYGLEIDDIEGNLVTINLPWNNLKGELPAEIFTISSLVRLNLEGNNLIGNLSEDFGNFTELSSLGLSNNNFSGSIPASFAKLTKLNYFSLFENKLTGEIPIELESMPNWETVIKDKIEPQLPGYGFTYPSTLQMIDLGDNFYMHPDGYAVEYRIDRNRLLTSSEIKQLFETFYTKFNDSFDFVQLVYNVLQPAELGVTAAASFNTVYNMDIEGLGLDQINCLSQYGSPTKLRGIVNTYSHNGLWAIYHELCHYWGAMDIGQEVVTYDGTSANEYGHWGISDVNGVLGGFKASTLERNVDGVENKYKASSPDGGANGYFFPVSMSSYYYAPIELYIMGLMPKEEVEPITVFKNVSGTTEDNPISNGVFYAEKEEIVTIDDIISKYGERNPSYNNSQKKFKMATIVISSRQIYDKEWNTIINCLKIVEAEKGSSGKLSFKDVTGGRGSITTTGLATERK